MGRIDYIISITDEALIAETDVNRSNANCKGKKMEDYKMALIDAVIAQIKVDVANNDFDSIAEMLDRLPNNVLEAYLPECVA